VVRAYAGSVAARLDQLPAWALDLLAGARVGRLGLIDDRDNPRVLPVTFVLHDGAFYSVVDQKPKRVPPGELARVRYLRRRPRAALTIDHYEDDWSALAWVQALGRADVLELQGSSGALDALRAKYEPYRASPPAGPLLRLAPERFLCWRAHD
jgi:PPOX class probable F420-dependent enzyme